MERTRRPQGCPFDAYGADKMFLELLTCENCPVVPLLCEYKITPPSTPPDRPVHDCKYLRDVYCYVTGHRCYSDPAECTMADKDFLVLDELEEECMERPNAYVCADCRGVFKRIKVEMIEECDAEGRRKGIFLCAPCTNRRLGYL